MIETMTMKELMFIVPALIALISESVDAKDASILVA